MNINVAAFTVTQKLYNTHWVSIDAFNVPDESNVSSMKWYNIYNDRVMK